MHNPKEIPVTSPTFASRTITFRNVLILIIITFAVLTLLAKQHNYFKLDLTITLLLQSINLPWFDYLMRFITFLGDSYSVFVIVALLSIYRLLIGRKTSALMIIFSTFGGLALSVLFKLLVSRPRPDPTLVNQIGKFIYSDSFPSGHVLGAVSLYGFILYLAYTKFNRSIPRIIVISVCWLMMILMGLSRIYLGVHWFSDVLGAYLLGFIWLSVVIFIYRKLTS